MNISQEISIRLPYIVHVIVQLYTVNRRQGNWRRVKFCVNFFKNRFYLGAGAANMAFLELMGSMKPQPCSEWHILIAVQFKEV